MSAERLSDDRLEEIVETARMVLAGQPAGQPGGVAMDFARALVQFASTCKIGLPCEKHGGVVHGREAEELRAGIEDVLKEHGQASNDERADLEEMQDALQRLLSEVDARDSLSSLEVAASHGDGEDAGRQVPASLKVVFLDIDGVLNSEAFARKIDEQHLQLGHVEPSRPKRATTCGCYRLERRIDRDAVARLNRLVAETGAKIVISSSWRRLLEPAEVHRLLVEQGLRAEVIGETPHGNADAELRAALGHPARIFRGHEIDFWLKRHPEVERFVILDDGSDMEMHKNRLVQTDFEEGLLDEHVDLAIHMLTWNERSAVYARAESERLCREAREDDARMTVAPWSTPSAPRLSGSVTVFIDGHDHQVAQASADAASCLDAPAPNYKSDGSAGRRLRDNATGIARTRNNLRAMTDQLEAAATEIARLRGSQAGPRAASLSLATKVMLNIIDASSLSGDWYPVCLMAARLREELGGSNVRCPAPVYAPNGMGCSPCGSALPCEEHPGETKCVRCGFSRHLHEFRHGPLLNRDVCNNFTTGRESLGNE